MKTYRIRIYSSLNGVEDFTGVDFHELKARALAKVDAYLKEGHEARYIGTA